MNLPNSLTIARIFLVPVLVSVLLTKFEGRLVAGLPVELVAAAIFGLASLTDWLDGYLARRRDQVTPLGQILDPLADKLLISATLISLVQLDLASAWMVGVIIGREIAVTALRNVAYSRGLAMPASGMGKLKMASQVTAILLLILGWERWPLLLWLGQAALWVVLLTAVVSGLDYYRDFQRAMGIRAAKVTDFAAAKSARQKEQEKKVS
ncbi:MAG: CDP-diacylglycerol--glycerol-3-phosphate 3-phosphatidyltransferase [Acidobacteriota bacterium]|nr:CDP-diacylglycerol--glycerol-3-phosphate 3-phosphatidyltransferase [Acidobacteriota bacterium]MDP3718469.1 CDP-diacylglycerol--glycerol-3-phosphate 3-phosphatidyltransferase [Acidobacteriota bacterium]